MGRGLHINQDVLAGLIFAVFGALILFFGRNYPIGTPLRMSSGFVPMMLGWALIGIGAVLGIKGALSQGEALDAWALRPLILVSGAFLVFALLVEKFGMVIAGGACMLVAAAGGKEFKWREQVVLAACAVTVAAVGFIHFLGLPMSYWPGFLRIGY